MVEGNELNVYIFFIYTPKLRIRNCLFRSGKGAGPPLEGAKRERRGATREQRGSRREQGGGSKEQRGREQGEQQGGHYRAVQLLPSRLELPLLQYNSAMRNKVVPLGHGT